MLSIITPVLNGSLFIEQTIQSILKLNIVFEHIVVDGGSTDKSLEIIKKYNHIKLIHQRDNEGIYKAIDIGIKSARGTYVTWVNADDRIISKNYEILYRRAKKEKASFACSDGVHHYLNEYRYKYVPSLPFQRFFLQNGIFPFVQPSCIFLKQVYQQVGGFNFKKFKIIGDRDLFQRFSYLENFKIIYVPLATSIFLRHKNSLYFKNIKKIKQEWNYTIKNNNSLYIKVFYHILLSFRKISREFF